ncbi:heat shock 70 kDa protein 14 [Artemisia annua]|uniref:Heat shock 70 kDa protein 14 n=1 Tax=Artemisia annua TaxID=35608 RepID=A0A2U1Q3F6_ARTAN|nr:heat shock 70 kDa protein 14 [Artemisia annua]
MEVNTMVALLIMVPHAGNDRQSHVNGHLSEAAGVQCTKVLARIIINFFLQVEATKKKVKKSNVPVSKLVYGAMLHVDVQKAVEKEFEMSLQCRILEESKDKKYVGEAYVYDMRNSFLTDPKRGVFFAKLQKTEG